VSAFLLVAITWDPGGSAMGRLRSVIQSAGYSLREVTSKIRPIWEVLTTLTKKKSLRKDQVLWFTLFPAS
jgi:hypothetical protein